MQTKLPKVSILTLTTYSRDKFIPNIIQNVLKQDYPHELIEWLVIGDKDEFTIKKFKDEFSKINLIKCKYIQCEISGDIGKKRNFACKNASHKILVNMDSDDFYQPSYISYSVETLRTKKVGITGCRDMLIFYPKIRKMVMIRGSKIHEATMVFTINHWKSFKFSSGMKAEGKTMVQGSYFNEMDIRKCMICLAHDSNSFDKTQFIDKPEVIFPDKQMDILCNFFSCI